MSEVNPFQSPLHDDGPAEAAPSQVVEQDLEGIKGWLVFVAFGVVLSPFSVAAQLLISYVPIFTDGTWESLASPQSPDYAPRWASLIFFELSCYCAFIITDVFLAYLFFRKSRLFPRVYIILAFINLGFIFADAFFASLVFTDEKIFDPDTVRGILQTLLSMAIWIPYMLLSRRVKNTFVR